MAQKIINWENITYRPKTASTAMLVGEWLQYDGTGHVQPLNPTSLVAGLLLQRIDSTDPDYAQTTPVAMELPLSTDEFIMPVSVGTATAAMVGSKFDVAAANSAALDVSGAGTQFLVVRFISATLVVVKVSLLA